MGETNINNNNNNILAHLIKKIKNELRFLKMNYEFIIMNEQVNFQRSGIIQYIMVN